MQVETWQSITKQEPRRNRAVGTRFRSGLERKIAAQLQAAGEVYSYEQRRIEYTLAAKSYVPDFTLPSGTIIECKGILTAADRAKYKLVKQQHPCLDIRFVFCNSKTKLHRTSRTTYAMWAQRLSFPFADGRVPGEWLRSGCAIAHSAPE